MVSCTGGFYEKCTLKPEKYRAAHKILMFFEKYC